MVIFDANNVVQIERRLAPFWKGLNDFSESWTEHQLMAAARGMPIPPPDVIPPELEYKLPPKAADGNGSAEKNIQSLTVPMSSRSPSYNSDASQGTVPAQSLPSTSPIASGSSSSPLFRGRAKTLAALTTAPKSSSQTDLAPREMKLPHDPFVNGQPIEAYLYKDATECPICFLYYPPYLNRTRCCDQPICSECFVQIKRPDPHPPEHGETDPNAAPDSEGGRSNTGEYELVSEPSACPFCVQPEFGVTYSPPPFRRGLVYTPHPGSRTPGNAVSPVSSTSSLSSANANRDTGRRRATSLSANDPQVVTTDKIRPDWAQKLANARAQAARRSAAATALHTAAYLMNSSASGNDSRNFGIGRRGVLRRTGGTGSNSPGSRTGSSALSALAFLTERRGTEHETDSAEEAPATLAPPRGSSRRSRIDDLEEMMMMEAIRMSLASEEERRRKEEKEARKEAKRREKEAKKAEKSARKSGLYSENGSSTALNVPPGSSLGRVESSSSSQNGEDASSSGKGKGVDRVSPAAATASTDLDPASSAGPADPTSPQFVNKIDQDQSSSSAFQAPPTEPSKHSHLRHVSSASSSSSSFVESASGEQIGSGTPSGANTSLQPMFNFRSLAAVIGDEVKGDESAEHVEDSFSNKQAELSVPGVPGGSKSEPTDSSDSAEVSPVHAKASDLHENGDAFAPKELEANSVEITGATRDAEATT